MTKRCRHEIAQKADYPDDYICRKCQTIWTYKNSMTDVEFMTFPLVVRSLIIWGRKGSTTLPLERN